MLPRPWRPDVARVDSLRGEPNVSHEPVMERCDAAWGDPWRDAAAGGGTPRDPAAAVRVRWGVGEQCRVPDRQPAQSRWPSAGGGDLVSDVRTLRSAPPGKLHAGRRAGRAGRGARAASRGSVPWLRRVVRGSLRHGAGSGPGRLRGGRRHPGRRQPGRHQPPHGDLDQARATEAVDRPHGDSVARSRRARPGAHRRVRLLRRRLHRAGGGRRHARPHHDRAVPATRTRRPTPASS